MTNLSCVACSKYLLYNPMQLDCGDRLCGSCYESYKERNQKKFNCPSCGDENLLEDCFRDKAVEYEIRNSTLDCLNPSCPWESESQFYLEHTDVCKFAVAQCPNALYGCKAELVRGNIDIHLKNECQFNPVTCRWCGKHTVDEETHVKKECDQVPQYCPNGCGERLPKREVVKHTRTVCTHQIRDCDYKELGCQYKGNIKELTKHAKEYLAYHSQLLKKANKEMKQSLESQIAQLKSEMTARLQPVLDAVVKSESAILQLHSVEMDGGAISCLNQSPHREESKDKDRTRLVGGNPLTARPFLPEKEYGNRLKVRDCDYKDLKSQVMATLNSQIAQLKSEMTARLQPVLDTVVKSESAILQLQDGLSEVSLLLQTLQAASYDGTFIWKIPEVTRRRQEAKAGKTVSLYSAPFHTSRHGYKVCLRLYMNGDGSGKGTHLSFFITLMRGEYDALLSWPFRQAVTLVLVDQNKQRDIVQSFRPEPTSSSFQRPRNEMNVASGCPMFAPLSVLDNSSFVKDDTMFLKYKINTTND